MPNPNEIDPTQLRERMIFETEESYKERMIRLDERNALIAKLFRDSGSVKEHFNSTD